MNVVPAEVSVVICTANRGASVVATLESVLANTHPSFEVILIDQSANRDTERAVARFREDSCFRYIRSTTKGKGRALNLGLSAAQGHVVALTDDDCAVPSNWLEVMAASFQRHPRIAVVFCNVVPAPYDESAGFIPSYVRHDSRLVRTLWQKLRARGIGAGMAVRRETLLKLGGFDEHLGPGSAFLSCDDRDIPVRALLHDLWVFETHEVAVVHDGFRTWQQGKELAKRNWYGLGAAYAKPFKCHHWNVIPLILYEALIMGLWEPFSSVFRLKKPRGVRRWLYFFRGFVRGLRTPVDCEKLVYRLD